MDVSKSVALVTGGAQGIGKEIVLQLLKEGAKVTIVDINVEEGTKMEEQCKNEYGQDRVLFKKCDVTQAEELRAVFEATKETFGSLDIVCNNAGIGDNDPNLATKMVQLNLGGVVEGTYKAIEMMSTKTGGKGGVVINMASTAGLLVGEHFPVYCATKAGVVSFSRCLTGYAKEGVRVNCVCPSFADTNMLKVALDRVPEFTKGWLTKYGYAELSDIVKAVMRCIKEEELVGNAITVLPNGIIHVVEFPTVPIVPTK